MSPEFQSEQERFVWGCIPHDLIVNLGEKVIEFLEKMDDNLDVWPEEEI